MNSMQFNTNIAKIYFTITYLSGIVQDLSKIGFNQKALIETAFSMNFIGILAF